MGQPCKWAIAHWLRFREPKHIDALEAQPGPSGCGLWKFGPDAPPSPRANRSGSEVWCGITAFGALHDAEAAFENPQAYVPGLGQASEAWQALLVPIVHRGECNYLDRNAPGPIFEESGEGPAGPLLVMTTAGFHLHSRRDFLRLTDFRRRVDLMRDMVAASSGSIAHQVFVPLTPGDDGATMSLWRDEASMLHFAYRPGPHRTEADRQVSNQTVDRSSFTRFRLVSSRGTWNGADPLPPVGGL